MKREDKLKELYTLKISALLHDVGKPESWAGLKQYPDSDKYPKHACATKLLTATLGDEISITATRHHKRKRPYWPQTDLEWIVSKADFIASGADRRGEKEEADRDKKGVTLPIEISHVLSYGTPIKKTGASELQEISQNIETKLKEIGKEAVLKPSEAYFEIYEFLRDFLPLRFIPADTRILINDVSLWHHLKLTAAIATSIWWDGPRGEDLPVEEYKFALLIGDADRIQDFINSSKRPPDLSERSEIIEKATKAAARAVETILGGWECIIFASAGGLLAITPLGKVRAIALQCEEEFRKATDDELKMVIHYEESDGERLMEHINEAWNDLFLAMRTRKLEDPTVLKAEVKEGESACDVCGFRPGIHEVKEHDPLPYDASPRYEKRCKVDYQRLINQKGRGIKLEDIADERELVAIIKTDGDSVASLFDGTKLRSLDKGKRMTPSRLSAISSLIDETCKTTLTRIVKEHGKHGIVEKEGKWMYAGGDDLLAVLPGFDAFDCASELEVAFKDEMKDQVTLSAGIVIFHKKFPIYVALEAVSQLLDNAKAQDGKASVDFEVISAMETTAQDLSKNRRRKLREAHLSGRPYKWDRFKKLQEFAGRLPEVMQSTQINRIAGIAFQEGVEAAKDYVKYQMGRGVIPWKLGEEFIGNPDEGKVGHLEEGFFLDAFKIYNAIYRKKEA